MSSAPAPPRSPRLEVAWAGGWENFRETLRALRAPVPPLPALARAAFRDATVVGRWPTRAVVLSAALHFFLVIVPLPEFLTRAPARTAALALPRLEYDLHFTPTSRVLPPISPRRAPKRKPSPGGQKGQPLPPRGAEIVHQQTIVSMPAEPNHPTQTVVRQNQLAKARLRDVRLPNMVIPPAPNPPPVTELDLRRLRIPGVPLDLSGPPRAPVPPRPRRASALALPDTQLANLFPKLAVPPSAPGEGPTPAPEVEAPVGEPRSGDLTAPGVIALSAQPAVPAPMVGLPESNLHARFVAGPYPGPGSPGGVPGGVPGTSGGSGGGPGGELGGAGGIEAPDILVTPAGPVPPGPVIVGLGGSGPLPPLPAAPVSPAAEPERESAPQAAAREKPARPPREASKSRPEELLEGLGPGGRLGRQARGPRIYTIYINMPNLTSQAGSWVLRFAEMGDEGGAVPGGAADGVPLEAPVPLKKIDPSYPAAARRSRIEGSVFLYGIIRRDGTVDSVEVVRSVHESLDHSAVAAFQRWQFDPGRKNGTPVSLEVIVEIPFRLSQLF